MKEDGPNGFSTDWLQERFLETQPGDEKHRKGKDHHPQDGPNRINRLNQPLRVDSARAEQETSESDHQITEDGPRAQRDIRPAQENDANTAKRQREAEHARPRQTILGHEEVPDEVGKDRMGVQ